MISLIAFILSMIGTLNWFFIGALQYDFVAAIFGSQANIFSRLIYFLVGVAGIVVLVNFITNKAKFVVSFKSAKDEYEKTKSRDYKSNKKKLSMATESAKDYSMDHSNNSSHDNKN